MTEIRASTTGSIWKILVAVGDTIVPGQEVAILESMKMEIPIEAEVSGRVTRVLVHEGESVRQDQVLMVSS
ncbi:MAG: biotin/lipoyl-binding protein [Chloroflexota bacterium]|nr:biotin/lipoyl-binding protein [Chloroflexota bacterium]